MKFNKYNIKLPARIIITGKSNTGKTVYAKTLLYSLADNIDKLYIFSPTYEDSPFIDIDGNKKVYLEYDAEKLNNIIKQQKHTLNNHGELAHVLILFDDCILDIHKNDKLFQSIFTRGRHYNISPIVITQRLRIIPPICRYNVDYVCCTKIYNSLEKEIIFNEFGNIPKKDFYKLLDAYTENYCLLIIDNTTTASKNIYLTDRGKLKLEEFYI